MSNVSETISLRGKTVAVQMRNRAIAAPIILSECSLETRGGRIFLVGMSLPTQRGGKEWSDGVRRAVAWDAVDEYLVFQSPEEYYACELPAPPVAMPTHVMPKSAKGYPVEPSGVAVEPETHLEVGSVVLAYWDGRWWRAELTAVESEEEVTVHFPGWDSSWDMTVPRSDLQVYLGDSIQSDDRYA